MYHIHSQKMSKSVRRETNKQILAAINSGVSDLSAEVVYNSYTVKNGKVTEESDIFEEFDISPDIIETLFRRKKCDDGAFHICWGTQKVS